eukprot:TRINITY_DN1663_c0_g1_i1.p1 TRINITY_DN1663_c0_g1~~TRINITY_DN1663_c0_g1_i1.p1  ORF type:complete len:210 (-),score=61.58 TRINITY_DN1663_c0_g1_i1:40-594(-)
MEPEDYGGVTEHYKWTQTEKDVTINLTFPKHIKAKDLDVVIKPKYLKFGVKKETPKMEGELFQHILVDDSIWSILDGDAEITLVKASSSTKWWKSVIIGHPETDVEFIEGSKYLDASLIKRIKEERRKKAEEEKKGIVSGGEEKDDTHTSEKKDDTHPSEKKDDTHSSEKKDDSQTHEKKQDSH